MHVNVILLVAHFNKLFVKLASFFSLFCNGNEKGILREKLHRFLYTAKSPITTTFYGEGCEHNIAS